MTNRIVQYRYPTPEEVVALTTAACRKCAQLTKVVFVRGGQGKWRFAHVVERSARRRAA
jgi:hypothetical protein